MSAGMRHITTRRYPETPPEPSPQDPILPRLHELRHLQRIRRIAADAELAIARHLLAQAQRSVEEAFASLTAREAAVRTKRRKSAQERTTQAASISVLQRWRQDEFAMLAGIERYRSSLDERREAATQAEGHLAASLRRRRWIEARREKYEALIDELNEAD